MSKRKDTGNVLPVFLETNTAILNLNIICHKTVKNGYYTYMYILYAEGLSGIAKELVSEFADSLPGIDEAKSFMQVMT